MKADDLRPHGVPKKTEIVHLVQTINVVVEICMPDTMHTTIPSTTEGCPQYLKRTMTYDTSKYTEWRRRYVYNGKNPLRCRCDGTKNLPCKMNCSRETTVVSLCPPRRLLCEVPLIIVIGPFLDSVSTHFYFFFSRDYCNYYTIITDVHTNS